MRKFRPLQSQGTEKIDVWLTKTFTMLLLVVLLVLIVGLIFGGWRNIISWGLLAFLASFLILMQLISTRKFPFTLLLIIALLIVIIFPSVTVIAAIDYHSIAKSIDTQTVKDYFKNELNTTYDYKQLIVWEWNHIQWLNNSDPNYQRNKDPIKIFEYGKGQCMEFAILYSALCKSQGYQCRIVDAPINDHAWTEVLVNDTWIRVDSSLGQNDTRAVGYPMFFEKEPNWTAPIIALAFDGDKIIDVTATYRTDGLNPLLIGSFTAIVFLTVLFIWKLKQSKTKTTTETNNKYRQSAKAI